MSRSLSFGPAARLRSRRDFSAVFARGRKVVARNLVLWAGLRLRPTRARLGLSVSAKLGNAVTRNRLKRLAREAFRLEAKRLEPRGDLVVYLRPGCRWKVRDDARVDIVEACRRAGLLLA